MATQEKEIALSTQFANMSVPQQMSVSTSPTATFQSPPGGFSQLTRTNTTAKILKPFNTTDIKILLLENVNQSGKDILSGQGYQVEALKSSLPEDQLIEKIRYVAGQNLPLQDEVLYHVLLMTPPQRRSRYRN